MFVFKHKLKFITLGIALVIGWQLYSYFLDNRLPVVLIKGISGSEYYSNDALCHICADKTGDVSLFLDDQNVVSYCKIKANQDSKPFVIPTKTLSNGKHILRTEFIDNTFSRNKVVLERDFYVDNQPLQAAFVIGSSYKVFQGRTLHVQFQVNKEIKSAKVQALSHTYECYPESKNSKIYECFIPIACEEQPNEYLLGVDIEDKVDNTIHLDNKFQIVMFPFNKEVITVTSDKVKQEKELGKDAKDFEDEVEKLSKLSKREKLWRGPFCAPIEIQRISCEFGTIRTTQHKGRYAHKALDVLNAPKSVVWAPQDGIVVMKDRFAPSGKTVIIDHGCGILSLFFHLDDFADIELGKMVAQGNPIGTIGKTGFATGYHLHWEMRINNIAIDPMQWTKATF